MYDFIVVGAGPAGSCLASRLARSNAAPEVLLLEAGNSLSPSDSGLVAERYTTFITAPGSNCRYQTVPQENIAGRAIGYHRGKGLGKSSIINFCAYTVGPRDDCERWADAVGDESFSWQNAVRLRKHIESYDNDLAEAYRKHAAPDMAAHGTNGLLKIEFPKVLEPGMTAHFDAAEDYGLGLNPDINSGNPIGLASSPSTSRSGRRVTAADAYLSDALCNLHIICEAHVTQGTFEGTKAVGVVAGGKEYRAAKEVVLSAGAIETPKILMLSGMGDKYELAPLGIESVLHLLGVGKSLEDHLRSTMTWRDQVDEKGWSALYTGPEALRTAQEQFAKDGTGPLSVHYHAPYMGYFKADEVFETPEYAWLPKDVQEHMKKPTVPLWEVMTWCTIVTSLADPKLPYLTVAVFLQCPQSRGTVKLASKDPQDAPVIDLNFLSHPCDRRCAIAATNRTLDFMETPLMSQNIKEPLDVPPNRSDEGILSWWRANSDSTWHASCTVKMGKADETEACLDPDFRVRGLQNPRMVDMSATPFLPNGHVQSVACFVGQCAVEKLFKEYGLDG